MKKKIQVTQNKCFHFWLRFNSREHIGAKEFKEINWLPSKEKVEQRSATKVFKYWKWTSSFHVNELFGPSRNAYSTILQVTYSFEDPLRKSNLV